MHEFRIGKWTHFFLGCRAYFFRSNLMRFNIYYYYLTFKFPMENVQRFNLLCFSYQLCLINSVKEAKFQWFMLRFFVSEQCCDWNIFFIHTHQAFGALPLKVSTAFIKQNKGQRLCQATGHWNLTKNLPQFEVFCKLLMSWPDEYYFAKFRCSIWIKTDTLFYFKPRKIPEYVNFLW